MAQETALPADAALPPGSGIGPYLPLLIHLGVVAAAVCGLWLLSLALGPRRPTRAEALPYECGNQAPGGARQLPAHFSLIAMLFILFDVEIVFLLPWASTARTLGSAALAEVAVFAAVLGLGLLYAWRKRALSLD